MKRFIFTVILIGTVIGLLFYLSCEAAVVPVNGTVNPKVSLTVPISGKINSTGRENDQNLIIAEDIENGKTYSTVSDTNGNFTLNLPSIAVRRGLFRDTLYNDKTFVIAVVSKTGKPLGILTAGDTAGSKITGIIPDAGLDLGNFNIPADLTQDVITASVTISDQNKDDTIYAKKSASGGILGVNSYGKGSEAMGSVNTSNKADTDQDGMIDILDADDDGDGIVDEFDASGTANKSGSDNIRIALGFLLDLEADDILDYYNPSETVRNTALIRDMRLDIWVMPDSTIASSIQNVRVLPLPGASYISTLLTGPAQAKILWSEMNYQIMIQPGSEPDRKVLTYLADNSSVYFETGDTFNFIVSYNNGTDEIYSRMINYVFKMPSLFVKTGYSGNLVEYNPDSNYWNSHPPVSFGEGSGGPGDGAVIYDNTHDLVIEMQPPQDELGNFMKSGAVFEVSLVLFPTEGTIDNQNIDVNLTYGSSYVALNPINWDFQGNKKQYNMDTDLTYYEPNSRFQITIPKELLPKTVYLQDSSVKTVAFFTVGTRFIVGSDPNSWDVSILQNRISFKFLY